MDQPLDIYVNVQRQSRNPSETKREIQSSQNIYENVLIHTADTKRAGPALSGNKHTQISLNVATLHFVHTDTLRQNILYFQKQLV